MKGLFFTLLMITTQFVYADSPEVFDGFWKNAKESFTENKTYHFAAIALTPALIVTDVDANVHNAFRGSSTKLFDVGDVMGYIGSFVLGVPLYVFGEGTHNKKTIGASYAVAQTTIITLSTVSILKGVTGRHPPRNDDSKSTEWQSRQFSYGVLNRGIFNGWPSGHMATITSLASAMIHYYPELEWVKYAGFGAMTYLMATISIHSHGEMHWFSDGVAGGLIGYAIGKTVGTNMRSHVTGLNAENEKKMHVLPMIGAGTAGVRLVWFQ